mmetsp:Transcript_944/g.2919  ORF Transcript_944/g.2919 Transcript_944/m.2919 type:complete len:227 (-) Transcript_944:405-1085(-)
MDSVEQPEGVAPADTGTGSGARSELRCPWNWKVCEAVCAVGASLAASEDWGEQESPDLRRHSAKEYKARAAAMAAASRWPVNGSADHPVLSDNIKWRCEAKPEGKIIWDRWLDIKREVCNILLPLVMDQLAKGCRGRPGRSNQQACTVAPTGRRWPSRCGWSVIRRSPRARARGCPARRGARLPLQRTWSTALLHPQVVASASPPFSLLRPLGSGGNTTRPTVGTL